MVAYNVFCFSILAYVAQLQNATKEMKETEEKCLKKYIAKGPTNWCSKEDLIYAKEYGQTKEFRSLDTTCKAAQLRVRIWDAGCGRDKEAAEERDTRPNAISERSYFSRQIRNFQKAKREAWHLRTELQPWKDWYTYVSP